MAIDELMRDVERLAEFDKTEYLPPEEVKPLVDEIRRLRVELQDARGVAYGLGAILGGLPISRELSPTTWELIHRSRHWKPVPP